MKLSILSRAAVCGAIAAFAALSPASAQATRTWVSGVGDDVNPCSRTAPCKTFAGAISKTAAGGEISVLDPGGFGAVTITKSISIVAVGAEGGVLAAGTNGVVVNIPSGKVTLKGLVIEGAGTGLNGVHILAGDVFIEDCLIRGFTGNGVNMLASSAARAYIRNCSIHYNNGGVNLVSGAGSAGGVVENSSLDRNTSFGLRAEGAGVVAVIDDTTILGTPIGLQTVSGAQIKSFGNNAILNGTPSSLLPLQ